MGGELVLLERISQCQEGFQGIFFIVEAMKVHIYDDTVVKEGALLLYSLRRASDLAIDALMRWAVEPCMRAVEVHKNDVIVYDALTALLAALPVEENLGALEAGPRGLDITPSADGTDWGAEI